MAGRTRTGLEWLVSETALHLLMPALKDVLEVGADEDAVVRLTYATASVMVSDLLAQRFPGAPWTRTTQGAIRRIAQRGGIDEGDLLQDASGIVQMLMEVQPATYLQISRLMDTAIDRAVFRAERAQGDVLVRLALERLAPFAAEVLQSPGSHNVLANGLLRRVRGSSVPAA